jgi:hypothetical protein
MTTSLFSPERLKRLANLARQGNFKAIGDALHEMGVHIGALSTAELSWLDGITAGTAAASKALVLDASANLNFGAGTFTRTGRTRILNTDGKAGATAGWAVGGGAVNTGLLATLPASQTGSTLVVPVPGLKVGDTITGFHLIGQIESAGGAVTLDADLRKLTAAAADVADASINTMTQISVTADTAITSANSAVTGLTEVVAADETFYLLLTGTTAASTDIALQGVALTVTES